MLMANGRGQTDLMFAALVVLAAQSLVLFAALERLARGGTTAPQADQFALSARL